MGQSVSHQQQQTPREYHVVIPHNGSHPQGSSVDLQHYPVVQANLQINGGQRINYAQEQTVNITGWDYSHHTYDRDDGEMFTQQHRDDGEIVTQQHRDDGEIVTQQHRDDGEIVTQQHRDEEEIFIQQHRDDGEIFTQQHRDEEEIFTQQHRDYGEIFIQQHRDDGEVFTQQHRDYGEIFIQQHRDYGEIFTQQHRDYGEIFTQQHRDDGEVFTQQHRDYGEKFTQQHRDDGEVFTQQHRDYGEIFTQQHRDDGEIFTQQHRDYGEIYTRHHRDDGNKEDIFNQQHREDGEMFDQAEGYEEEMQQEIQMFCKKKQLEEARNIQTQDAQSHRTNQIQQNRNVRKIEADLDQTETVAGMRYSKTACYTPDDEDGSVSPDEHTGDISFWDYDVSSVSSSLDDDEQEQNDNSSISINTSRLSEANTTMCVWNMENELSACDPLYKKHIPYAWHPDNDHRTVFTHRNRPGIWIANQIKAAIQHPTNMCYSLYENQTSAFVRLGESHISSDIQSSRVGGSFYSITDTLSTCCCGHDHTVDPCDYGTEAQLTQCETDCDTVAQLTQCDTVAQLTQYETDCDDVAQLILCDPVAQLTQYETDCDAVVQLTPCDPVAQLTQYETDCDAVAQLTQCDTVAQLIHYETDCDTVAHITQSETDCDSVAQLTQCETECDTVAQLTQYETKCDTVAQITQHETDCDTVAQFTQCEIDCDTVVQLTQYDTVAQLTQCDTVAQFTQYETDCDTVVAQLTQCETECGVLACDNCCTPNISNTRCKYNTSRCQCYQFGCDTATYCDTQICETPDPPTHKHLTQLTTSFQTCQNMMKIPQNSHCQKLCTARCQHSVNIHRHHSQHWPASNEHIVTHGASSTNTHPITECVCACRREMGNCWPTARVVGHCQHICKHQKESHLITNTLLAPVSLKLNKVHTQVNGDGQNVHDTCDGDGQHVHGTCAGDGQHVHGTCDGDGQHVHDTCDGDGQHVHDTCDGQHVHDTCDGQHVHDTCDGDGQHVHDTCDGDGQHVHDTCDEQDDIDNMSHSGTTSVPSYDDSTNQSTLKTNGHETCPLQTYINTSIVQEAVKNSYLLVEAVKDSSLSVEGDNDSKHLLNEEKNTNISVETDKNSELCLERAQDTKLLLEGDKENTFFQEAVICARHLEGNSDENSPLETVKGSHFAQKAGNDDIVPVDDFVDVYLPLCTLEQSDIEHDVSHELMDSGFMDTLPLLQSGLCSLDGADGWRCEGVQHSAISPPQTLQQCGTSTTNYCGSSHGHQDVSHSSPRHHYAESTDHATSQDNVILGGEEQPIVDEEEYVYDSTWDEGLTTDEALDTLAHQGKPQSLFFRSI